MRLKKDDIILCHNDEEFIEVAKYLHYTLGHTVANFNGKFFTEVFHCTMNWVGIIAWNDRYWIRTSKYSDFNTRVIEYQTLLRKDKLIRMNLLAAEQRGIS